MSFSTDDYRFMAQAIKQAEKGCYSTKPNPRVGCVLVKAGEVIGQGAHIKAGSAHAEVNAIAASNQPTIGATAYVTLEPCSHHGKTPPCCEALIKAGVTRVVVAMQDPNPQVAGKGISTLKQAGITVEVGLLEQQAQELNKGFIKRMQQGLPWVVCKMAQSLDGRTAMASGESQWITGAPARRIVQQMRGHSGAIITGVETVLLDNPSLNFRLKESGLEGDIAIKATIEQPIRVIVDSQMRTPLEAKIITSPGRVIIATAINDISLQQSFDELGVEVKMFPNAEGQVDLVALLNYLAKEEQINDVLLESGASLAGAMLNLGLIDQLQIFMAPVLLGSSAKPLFNLPLEFMAQRHHLQIDSIVAVGNDWQITATPTSNL